MKTNQLPQGTPLVSIIVPSYNEGEWLERTVSLLLNHTDYPSFEVIVVDDNSNDGSTDFLRLPPYSKANNLRWTRHQGDENLGVSLARHAGTQLAHGALYIFLDAHMTVDPDWVTQIVQAFQKNPSIGLAAPMVYDLQKPHQKGNVSSFVYTNCDISMWAPQWLNGTSFKTPTAVPFVNAAGLCIPRTIYEEVGGFPDWIKGWGPEDRCLSLLAYRFGYRSYRLPDVFIGHEYKEGLAQKNPELLALRHRDLTRNCLDSCYLLYDEADFNLAKARLGVDDFTPTDALIKRKEWIDEQSTHSYEDFVKEFDAYLPYRRVEFFKNGLRAKRAKNLPLACSELEAASEIEFGFGKTTPWALKVCAWLELADLYYQEQNYDQGLKEALRVFSLPIDYPLQAYVMLGKLFIAQQAWSTAVHWLQQGDHFLETHSGDDWATAYQAVTTLDLNFLKAELYDWLSVALHGVQRSSEAQIAGLKALEYFKTPEQKARVERNLKLYQKTAVI